MFVLILAASALGLYMAFNIGANDVANSMADAVGSKAISIKRAVVAAAICEFAGAVLVGAHVTSTIRKGIVSPDAFMGTDASLGAATLAVGMVCALAAAAIWLNLATWKGLPVSTTHSIVGAITGVGVIAAGWSAIHWGKMGQIVASWIISPLLGALGAFLLFKFFLARGILDKENPAAEARKKAPVIIFLVTTIVLLAIFFKGLKHLTRERAPFLSEYALHISLGGGVLVALIASILVKRYLRGKTDLPLEQQIDEVERIFAPMVVITSCSVAFAHGANDVANAVGPLAAAMDALHTATIKAKVEVPTWILALGGTGIVIGLATYGYRVMSTVGEKITPLTPSRGVAADIAAAAVVLLCSRLKLPVSTTHVLVGAILGIGFARGIGAINMGVARDILYAWFVTVPVAAFLAAGMFAVSKVLLIPYVSTLLGG